MCVINVDADVVLCTRGLHTWKEAMTSCFSAGGLPVSASYDDVIEMTYTSLVLKDGQRMWTSDYTSESHSGTDFKITSWGGSGGHTRGFRQKTIPDRREFVTHLESGTWVLRDCTKGQLMHQTGSLVGI